MKNYDFKNSSSVDNSKYQLKNLNDNEVKTFFIWLQENYKFDELSIEFQRCGSKAYFILSNFLLGINSFSNFTLVYGDIKSKDVKRFFQALGSITKLSTIHLVTTLIEKTKISYLQEYPRINSTISHLSLTYCNLEEKDIKDFLYHISASPSITYLNLSGNPMGNQGVSYISSCLKSNSLIQTLRINDIFYYDEPASSETVKCFMSALKSNTSLTRLSYAFNKLGNAGITPFTEGLRINTKLTYLDLSFNRIGDTGIKKFSEMLKLNSSIIRLNLEENQITRQGFQYLLQALRNNTSLTALSLINNRLRESIVFYLQIDGLPNFTNMISPSNYKLKNYRNNIDLII